MRFSVGESFFFDVVDFMRGGVCRRPMQVILSLSLYNVEAIISTVTLSRDPLTKVYEIDHADGMAMDVFVARQP